MINVARIGHVFGQDPIALLRDQGDQLLTEIRLAALAVVNRDEEEKARKSAPTR